MTRGFPTAVSLASVVGLVAALGSAFASVATLAPVLAFGVRVVGSVTDGLVGSAGRRRVDDVPLPAVAARGRVGPNWARRRGLQGDPVPGEIDSFRVYDREGFDATRVHPEIGRFYERTGDYDLTYETRWHRGFRTGARLAARLTSRLEQLNLPGDSDAGPKRLESRIAAIRSTAEGGDTIPEPLADSRVWTRTDPATGEAIFVAVYATHERDGVTYANVAVPLPWATLATVLRPEALEAGPDAAMARGGSDATGVRFTTRGPGDGGLYLVTRPGGVRLPMTQSFRVWPAGAPGAPRGPTDDPDLVASHDMWVFGRRFLTIRYGIERRDE